eukprot:jgi/Ulvmu1/10054/UM006_0001.1
MEPIKRAMTNFINELKGGGKAQASKLPQDGKAVLGNATWTFLHTLAAQYPDQPNGRQKKDTKTLISCMSRMYPCAQCAQHFEAYVKRNPPDVSCKGDLEQWVCTLHNDINGRLGKPGFNCRFVRSRWQELDCDVQHSCSLDVARQTSKLESPWR